MRHLFVFKSILELKRYSPNTVDVYLSFVKSVTDFLNIQPEKLSDLSDRDILLSVVNLTKHKNYGLSSQKQLIGALSLFYKEVLKREVDFSVIYPSRKEDYIPVILSKQEIKQLLKVTKNIKHKAILATIYGLGLRIGEAIALKVVDIDSDRMMVHIKNSKGKKDRMVMLPENLLILLRRYVKEYKPNEYLFEGQQGGSYSATSIRKTLNKSLAAANISKSVTVHSLRHSFATHLLENGTDVRIIQKLLGHRNINTTLTYTRVAETTLQKVKSPLDML